VTARPVGGLGFDRAFAALSGVSVLGLYLDGWVHNNIASIETFFTPWHAVLYAGFGAVGALTAFAILRNTRAGFRGIEAIPPGYLVSAIGIAIYAVGGVGDLIWHTVFGIESRVEALLSPSHLTLLIGAALFRIGPLRAAWLRPDDGPHSWSTLAPAILATTYVLSSFSFFTQYVHPLGLPVADATFAPTASIASTSIATIPISEYLVGVGIVSVMFQTMLLMSFALLLIRRWGWHLPFGTFTLMLGVNGALMVAMRGRYLPDPVLLALAPLGAGIVADLILRATRPTADRVIAFRVFALAVPMSLYAFYFVALFLSSTVWWTFPMWSGIILLAGLIGYLTSFIEVPTPAGVGARTRAG
jgi:hypothetical protein